MKIQGAHLPGCGATSKSKIGESFNSVTRMLGGRQRNAQQQMTPWSINRAALVLVIQFAKEFERFCSRKPPRYVAGRHIRMGEQGYKATISHIRNGAV